MGVYVFWSNYDGSYITTCESREKAETEVAKLLARDYGTAVHGVVEGRLLVIHEREEIAVTQWKVTKVKLTRDLPVGSKPRRK